MTASDSDLRLLQALCQTGDPALLRRGCRALARHRWARVEHQVVFESCADLTRWGARIERLPLAARLTRAGFPDVDLDALFAPLPAPERILRRHLDRHEGQGR